MNYPRMYHVYQVFEAPKVVNIEEALNRELESVQIRSRIKEGSRIAITAGSRGIANIDQILKHLVHFLKENLAKPFLIPAMGSHGGGTAEGQLEILRSLNITEGAIGAPIISSMEVVEIGRSSFGFPVLVDKHAAEADGIIVVNRIKPHTEFEGPIESGLMKMMAIGMGKHKGCLEVHKQTVHYGYREVIPEIGRIILERLPILLGVGIVENIYDETAMVQAIPPSQFLVEEKRLLAEAKRLMARLPFDKMDVLIVDEMGKNISGTGMDTNVIGRIMFIGEKEPERPRITRIVVLNLTDESHGNAVGIGLADYTTQRLLEKMDPWATSINAITAMTPEKGRIPIVLKTDKEAMEAALNTIGAVDPEKARVVHIKNTLEIGELDISEAFMREVEGREDLKLVKELGPLSFDGQGNLNPVIL
ncbi:MAG: lactate racemase domain-containing protein [Thermodesulfobacteriota bacterium]|nr:lactate racemase domain-containing protein [Thermodesulfobacteriota bacterium]